MSLVQATVRLVEDSGLVEQENLVSWPTYAYGILALGLLLTLLLLVTRLDLDR